MPINNKPASGEPLGRDIRSPEKECLTSMQKRKADSKTLTSTSGNRYEIAAEKILLHTRTQHQTTKADLDKTCVVAGGL